LYQNVRFTLDVWNTVTAVCAAAGVVLDRRQITSRIEVVCLLIDELKKPARIVRLEKRKRIDIVVLLEENPSALMLSRIDRWIVGPTRRGVVVRPGLLGRTTQYAHFKKSQSLFPFCVPTVYLTGNDG
jgi:hypothetical protein